MQQWYRKVVAFVVVSFFVSGCGGGSSLDEPSKVTLKGGELIADFPANVIKEDLVEKKLIAPTQSVFGFRAYKVPYTTTDEEGKEVNASGVVVLPSTLGVSSEDAQKLQQMNQLGLSIVVDDHGTIFANKEAPSVLIAETMMPEGAPIIFSSLAGFITMQPDYIGFGDSKEHYHPYLLKQSSATATVDFYKAAKKFIEDNNLAKLNSGIYLSGYSQGGYVALAALKEFENEGITVNVTAPMAGPYLLDPIAQGVLSLDSIAVPSFMAAVAHAYATRYQKDSTTLIQEPYASRLSELFDSKAYTREEIDKQLTTKVSGENGLFTDDIVQNYSGSWFQQVLQANSVVDFAPTQLVTLIHCQGDDVISYDVSVETKKAFANYFDVEVDLVPVEIALTGDPNTELRYTHAECAPYAYSIASSIFAKDRKNTVGY